MATYHIVDRETGEKAPYEIRTINSTRPLIPSMIDDEEYVEHMTQAAMRDMMHLLREDMRSEIIDDLSRQAGLDGCRRKSLLLRLHVVSKKLNADKKDDYEIGRRLERSQNILTISMFLDAAKQGATEMSPEQLEAIQLVCSKLISEIQDGPKQMRRKNSPQARQADGLT